MAGGLKAVLFDLDGTLIDSLELIRRTYELTFEQLDLSLTPDDALRLGAIPLREICSRLGGVGAEELFQGYMENYGRLHDEYTKIFPGVKEVLAELSRRGCLMGVVTSKTHYFAHRGLELYGLTNYLQVVVTADDVKAHKPHPEPLLKALAALSCPGKEALFVGDSPFDVMAGKAAGTGTAGVLWGWAGRSELESSQPDYLLEEVSQLLQVIE